MNLDQWITKVKDGQHLSEDELQLLNEYFAQLEHAKAAQSLNGKLKIAGRTIKVSSVADHVGVQDSRAKTADFDDDDGGGLALNAQSRALLMQNLDRSGTASRVVGSIGVPALNESTFSQATTIPTNSTTILPPSVLPAQLVSMAPEPIGTLSECLLLKNMFDPAAEVDIEFDLDIRDDLHEECSKYGKVKHIYVDNLQEQSRTNTTTNLNMMKSEVNEADLSTPV